MTDILFRKEFLGTARGLTFADTASVTWAFDKATNRLTATASGGGGGGPTALDDLTDVTITAAANGDILKYNGSAWVDDPLLGIPLLTDPGADRLLFWDDSAGVAAWLTLGTGLSITGTTIDVTFPAAPALDDLSDVNTTGLGTGDLLKWNGSSWVDDPVLGIGDLTDPGADRIMFWDDSAGTLEWLTIGSGLSITGTTISSSGGSFALDDLTDVTITSPVSGALLQYNGSAWVDGDVQSLSAEILADSPRGYWKLDGATTATDSSGNGYDMAEVGTVSQNFSALVPTTPSSTYAKWDDGANGFSITSNLGTSPPLTGDYTIEAVVCIPNFGASAVRIFAMSASGETEAANYQALFNVTTAGLLQNFWENGAGTNVTIDSGVQLYEGLTYHLACVKDGTANTVTFYVNGVKVRVVSYATEPSGGTSASLISTIGYDGTGNSGEAIMGHVAFFNSKLTDARIRVHAQAAGLFPIISGAAGSTDHGALGGLADDDHTQYGEVAGTETVSGVWTWTARIEAASSTGSIGIAAAPSYTFAGDTDTGMYSSNANQISFSTGGVSRLSILSNGQLTAYTALNTAATPAIGGDTDGNTGISWSAADTLALSTGGTFRATLTTTDLTLTVPVLGPAGSATAPTYSFSADPNTGMHNPGADNLYLATGGTARVLISGSDVSISLPTKFTASPASSLSGAILMTSSIPLMGIEETGAGTDEKVWDFLALSGQLRFRTATDAGAGNVDWLTVDRTGTTVDLITLVGTGVKLNGQVGFQGTAPIAKPTVTGSRGGNAALASLLTELANYGLITDSSTA
jgi:Concanavalin A-like lectin/glucanases superfamily